MNLSNLKSCFKIQLKSLFHRMTTKEFNFAKLNSSHLNIDKKDINFSAVSCSCLAQIHSDTGVLYFRECTKNEGLQKNIDRYIDRFFFICENSYREGSFGQPNNGCIKVDYEPELIASFKQCVLQAKESKNFYKKIKNLPTYYRTARLSLYRKGGTPFSEAVWRELGIPNCVEAYRDIANYFASFLNRGLLEFYNNKNRKFSTFSAVAFFATAELDQFFGLGLVSIPQIVSLSWGNECLNGFVCKDCNYKLDLEKRFKSTPLLQRALNNLHILDLLCYQTDHGPNNYAIIVDNLDICNICAFDNDGEKTFFCSSDVKVSLSWNASPLVDEKGVFNRPFIDCELYQRMVKTKPKELKKLLKPYLSNMQLHYLILRFQKLKKAMIKAVEKGVSQLLSNEEWTAETMEKELNGDYGRTYLYIYETKEIG